MNTLVAVPPRRRAETAWSFGLFSALLAVALVLDQLWWGGFEVRSPHTVVVLAALWVLLCPGSVGRFAAMVAAMVVAVALDMPVVGSHRLLELICGGCVLGYLGWTTLRARHVPAGGAVFEVLASFLRGSLIVVYAFSALAKTNTGFVDPAVSCAAVMSRRVAWFEPSLIDGSWRVEPAIWATVVIEIALPVLLAVPRTRLPALALGVGFHTVLALAGNVPFSALAFAFYVAFLPAGTPERVRALLARRPGLARGTGWVGRGRVGQVIALGVLVAAWLAGAASGTAEPAPGLTGTPTAAVSTPVADGTRLVVVVLALVGASVLVVARRAVPVERRPRARPPRVGRPILVVGILGLVLNGLCPYLGLKTDTSFEMFSGLRTEPGAWNHLVVPEAVRVFGYQDQLVRVVASNDPALVARTSAGTRLVRFELDRYLRSHPGTVATYTATLPRREQTTRTAGPLAPGPTFAEWAATFHDVPPPGAAGC